MQAGLALTPGPLCNACVQKHAKEVAATEAWRRQHTREERKKRYRDLGQAEKRSAAKKQKRSAED
jgi:hypothetical protein